MWIMVREGTAARNLEDLLPLVTPTNARRFFFVTDDRHPRELLEEGHIDAIVRKAIRLGLDPILAIQMATLNAAEYFRLDDLGAIAPGYRADIVVFDHLSRFRIKRVFKNGQQVADNGRLFSSATNGGKESFRTAGKRLQGKGAVRVAPVKKQDLLLYSKHPLAKVIQLIPGQIVTRKVLKKVTLKEGVAYADIREDILKMVVVERHRATGNVGIGFVQGFGLARGAIGSSVAHDSHNFIIVGTTDEDILLSIRRLKAMGGGLVTVLNQKVLADLPLPIAGLMAEIPVTEVHQRLNMLLRSAQSLGCKLPDPFMTLSFLALPVIPELKLTDKGLVDVTQFKIVPLFGKD
jgi:adenine deaminase